MSRITRICEDVCLWFQIHIFFLNLFNMAFTRFHKPSPSHHHGFMGWIIPKCGASPLVSPPCLSLGFARTTGPAFHGNPMELPHGTWKCWDKTSDGHVNGRMMRMIQNQQIRGTYFQRTQCFLGNPSIQEYLYKDAGISADRPCCKAISYLLAGRFPVSFNKRTLKIEENVSLSKQ